MRLRFRGVTRGRCRGGGGWLPTADTDSSAARNCTCSRVSQRVAQRYERERLFFYFFFPAFFCSKGDNKAVVPPCPTVSLLLPPCFPLPAKRHPHHRHSQSGQIPCNSVMKRSLRITAMWLAYWRQVSSARQLVSCGGRGSEEEKGEGCGNEGNYHLCDKPMQMQALLCNR